MALFVKRMAIAMMVCGSAGLAMADEIKVGAVAPLSGAQALLGISLQNGMKMDFNEVNAKGGVNGHTFSLVQGDDKGDPREGTLVGQKFCDDDQILALLGHLNSGVQLAALPIYQGCGMPEVVLGSNPTITEQGAENIVRPTANDFEQAGLAATYALQTQKATTAAVVNDKQAFGQGVAKLFEAKYKAGGGTVVGSSAVNPTDIDFTAVITQIKAKNPGVVYFGAVMPQLALFAKQMKEQGLDAKLLVPDGAYTPDFIKQAGAAAAENTLITFPLPPADSNTKLVQFGEDYKRMFNEAPGPYSAYGYIAAQVVVKAIAQTGAKPSRETILPKLKEVKIDTILGSIQFKPNGDMTTAPMHLYKVEGDAFKLVSSNQ